MDSLAAQRHLPSRCSYAARRLDTLDVPRSGGRSRPRRTAPAARAEQLVRRSRSARDEERAAGSPTNFAATERHEVALELADVPRASDVTSISCASVGAAEDADTTRSDLVPRQRRAERLVRRDHRADQERYVPQPPSRGSPLLRLALRRTALHPAPTCNVRGERDVQSFGRVVPT
jgi:hypothetical protein